MKQSDTNMVLGFIAGAAIGAIAGILLAPDSGAVTRKKIIDKSGDLKDTVKDAIIGFIDKLQTDTDAEVQQENLAAVPKMNADIL